MMRKRLGQHYLKDVGVVKRMVALAAIRKSDRVLEIGTGRGALTRELSFLSEKVEAYEIDKFNYEATLETLRDSKVKLHLGDAFRAEPSFDVLVSSLPYSESSNFIRWLSQKSYDRSIVLLQEDFVNKLLAAPGEEGYGAISVISQVSSVVDIRARVARRAFEPPPRVNSVMVTIRPKGRLEEEDLVVIKRLFSQRRRTLRAAVKHLGLDFSATQDALDVRVFNISPERLMRVVRRINQR